MARTGRPTKYDPAYCDVVIAAGEAGKSIAWMAAEIGVSKDTIYEWAKVHPDFSDALTHAKLLSQRWWEDEGQKGIWGGKDFNPSAWSRSMAARFPEDWREVKGHEHTGKDGGPIEVASKEQRDAAVAAALRADK